MEWRGRGFSQCCYPKPWGDNRTFPFYLAFQQMLQNKVVEGNGIEPDTC